MAVQLPWYQLREQGRRGPSNDRTFGQRQEAIRKLGRDDEAEVRVDSGFGAAPAILLSGGCEPHEPVESFVEAVEAAGKHHVI